MLKIVMAGELEIIVNEERYELVSILGLTIISQYLPILS